MGQTETSMAERFPRAAGYRPEWVARNGMGSNPVWMAEWLSEVMRLEPGMRVLDLGCGKAVSAIFLAREYGVTVWATDLWIAASENWKRIRDAKLEDRIYPIHADARGLPYAAEFFDAIVSHDAYSYFGTDSLYLNYLAQFVKPGGQIGVAGAALTRELEDVPAHLAEMWTQDFWAIHSAGWWRRLWERTGIVAIEACEMMPEGWKVWLEWQHTAQMDNQLEIEGVRRDRGETLGYFRMVGRREADVALESYCWPDGLRAFPPDYVAEAVYAEREPGE